MHEFEDGHTESAAGNTPINELTPALQRVVSQITTHDDELDAVFRRCFVNTWETTVHRKGETTFVLTGDIPALWLRDSAAQVRPYVFLARHDPELATALMGLVAFHAKAVLQDPWANAFNADWSIWEQKYELDSLCYVIRLAYDLHRLTGMNDHLTAEFRQALDKIIGHMRQEQQHLPGSYNHHELARDGIGAEAGFTGMVWSGFRPSDDACTYPYLVPSNMFAAVTLEEGARLHRNVYGDEQAAIEALRLSREIRGGIERHARVQHPEHGWVWAYEVDGLGGVNLMDDANIPSLLSASYLGYVANDDPLYQNTRRLVLSKANPFFRRGQYGQGIGSPHTDQYGVPGSIWPLALAMQGLTAMESGEVRDMVRMLVRTTAGTGLMHEGFHPDDPSQFSRSWFAWANSLFSELILTRWFGLNWQPEAGLYIKPSGVGTIGSEGIPFGHMQSLTLKITGPGSRISSAHVNGAAAEVTEKGVHIPLDVTQAEVEIVLS